MDNFGFEGDDPFQSVPIASSSPFLNEMNDDRVRDSKSITSNTTATTQSTMSTGPLETKTKESKSRKDKKQSDSSKEKKNSESKEKKSTSDSKDKKSKEGKDKKKSKSEKSSKNGKVKKSSSANFDTDAFATGSNFEADFDTFSMDSNGFGFKQEQDEEKSGSRPKLRARRRNSLGAMEAISRRSAGTDGFDTSGDEMASFDGTVGSRSSRRNPPRPSLSSDSLESSPSEANKSNRQPRRRARRSSAIGNIGADAASFASYSSGASASELGFEEQNFGNGDQSKGGFGGDFSTDFGNFGNDAQPQNDGKTSVRRAPRRMSVGSGSNLDDPVDVRDHQRKLIDDIAFGTAFDTETTSTTISSGGGSNFMVPMADIAAAPENTGRNERRPRRRASLTLGSSFANHQALDVDAEEAERKQQNKTGFFKDRSDRQKLNSKSNATNSRGKPNEKLTGYDFDRDRRRFMG